MSLSPQIIELLILAGVAFFIINKLISKLGATNDDENGREKSYFGEFTTLKDVTSTDRTKSKDSDLANPIVETEALEIEKLFVAENTPNILKGLSSIKNYIAFSETKFISASKMAFKMIIDSQNDTKINLAELIDQRYIEQYKSIVQRYGKVVALDRLDIKFSEVYMFGNNIFIKLLFTGFNVLDKIENLHEEWTFSKRIDSKVPNWYLSNIDVIQKT